MANPSPQHNPTDGLGTATQITLTAAAQALTTVIAGRVYTVTLSVSATGFASSTTLTATIKDVGGSAFTSGNGNAVSYKSYNNPSAGAPSWLHLSQFAGYAADVASVSTPAGVITALAPGQAVIEAKFPTFDTTDGVDFVYVHVIVTVVP